MLRREEGQITVFVALLFFVLMGVSLCVLEGMYSFSESALAESAIKGAGNYVLANYNRSLFDRYHLFFLDPREREQVDQDGKAYLSASFGDNSFFQPSCSRLEVTEERTAVDEDGLYLRHQIREWMKYREVEKAGETLKELFASVADIRKGDDLAKADMSKAENAIAKEKEKSEAKNTETAGEGREKDSSGGGGADDEKEPGGDTEAREKAAGDTGIRWKEILELLSNITRSGILVYVTDDIGAVSQLSVSVEGLPSGSVASEKDAADFFSGALSFLNVDEWKKILSDIQAEEGDSRVLSDEFYLLEYIEENFGSYVRKSEEESALLYETEYLIAGKDSDRANLKAVADRMLGLRFLANYAYLSQDGEWKTASGSAAAVLTGILGFPQARKAVQVLLTAAVSFGESMLDVHALFSGEEVPVIKDDSTWNLTLENAAVLLKNRGPVKQGRWNAGYEDYLKLFLASRLARNRLLFRMMDIMQLNVALEQPDFRMEDCLFAFRWEADFSCGGWLTFFPGIGQHGGGFTMELERLNSY